MEQDIEIVKEAVIGFIITQPIDGRLEFKTRAIRGDWEGYFMADDLCDDGLIEEKVIGVLPAPQNTFYVLGFGADHEGTPLGFEFAGAYHPDWVCKCARIERGVAELLKARQHPKQSPTP